MSKDVDRIARDLETIAKRIEPIPVYSVDTVTRDRRRRFAVREEGSTWRFVDAMQEIRYARQICEDAEYHLRAIRSHLDQIINDTVLRDEYKEWLRRD